MTETGEPDVGGRLSNAIDKYKVGQKVRASWNGDVISGVITSLHGVFDYIGGYGSRETEHRLMGMIAEIETRLEDTWKLDLRLWKVEVLP